MSRLDELKRSLLNDIFVLTAVSDGEAAAQYISHGQESFGARSSQGSTSASRSSIGYYLRCFVCCSFSQPVFEDGDSMHRGRSTEITPLMSHDGDEKEEVETDSLFWKSLVNMVQNLVDGICSGAKVVFDVKTKNLSFAVVDAGQIADDSCLLPPAKTSDEQINHLQVVLAVLLDICKQSKYQDQAKEVKIAYEALKKLEVHHLDDEQLAQQFSLQAALSEKLDSIFSVPLDASRKIAVPVVGSDTMPGSYSVSPAQGFASK